MKVEAFIVLIFSCLAVYGERPSLPNYNRGYLCTESDRKETNTPTFSPHIAYQFDSATETCLAFKYLGCGGNNNRFSSERDCRQFTTPADSISCPMGSDVYRPPENDETTECRKHFASRSNNNCAFCDEIANFACLPKCPDTHVRLYGTFSPLNVLCCNKEISSLYNGNVNPGCPHGKFKRIGRSCADDFCDEGYYCVPNRVFAFCCPRAA